MTRGDPSPMPSDVPYCDACRTHVIPGPYGHATHKVAHLEWLIPRTKGATARRSLTLDLAHWRGELITNLRAIVDELKGQVGDRDDRIDVLTFERDENHRQVEALLDAVRDLTEEVAAASWPVPS